MCIFNEIVAIFSGLKEILLISLFLEKTSVEERDKSFANITWHIKNKKPIIKSVLLSYFIWLQTA